MKKDTYVLRNEKGKIELNRDVEGVFTTQIYPLLVNDLIDKLKVDSDKYSEKLIELKENRYDIKTITKISELLGYRVELMSLEEINEIRYGKIK